MQPPRLIAFEGVDGAGKTTALCRVAETLRERGHRVFLPREGKEHASEPTRRIRELTRSTANIDLVPRAELALYCAREAQLLDELIKPALARGETVLMDRSLLTPLVLGAFGRGLDRQLCESVTRAAEAGTAPDLTLVFDVHSLTSHLRKRLQRIRANACSAGGRKGLGGSGLQERVRAGYLALAEERGMPVFHAERAPAEVVVERVVAFLEHGAPPSQTETPDDSRPVWQVDPHLTLEQALASVPAEVALYLSSGLIAGRPWRRAHLAREPELCAWALDEADPLFDDCLERSPGHALGTRAGQPLLGADDVRLRALPQHPGGVIASLRYLNDPAADALRFEYASLLPGTVLASLVGREDPVAIDLRTRLWDHSPLESRAISITECGSAASWRLRDEVFEQSPYLGLKTLCRVGGERADRMLLKYAERAEKPVLAALVGRSDAVAHSLRRDLYRAGREVVESLQGLEDEASWCLREQLASRYPSTVLHSLLGLAATRRARSLRALCEQHGSGDLHSLRRSRELDEQNECPATRRSSSEVAPLSRGPISTVDASASA